MTTPDSPGAPLAGPPLAGPPFAGPPFAGAAPEPTAPAPPARSVWRRRALLLAVAAVSTLVGAGAATGVLLATGLPGQPEQRYAVNVYLKTDATAQQKAAIEAAMPSFKPRGAVTFENRDVAWQKFKEMTKDRPDLLEKIQKDALPESFRLETEGPRFDCTGYAKVRHLPGVDKIQVLQRSVDHYVADITCDAEYEKP